jgi:two-component sensor histidine kinase
MDIQGSPSMGLKLVASFVEQLHGRLAVERDGGTVISVAVPRNAA